MTALSTEVLEFWWGYCTNLSIKATCVAPLSCVPRASRARSRKRIGLEYLDTLRTGELRLESPPRNRDYIVPIDCIYLDACLVVRVDYDISLR